MSAVINIRMFNIFHGMNPIAISVLMTGLGIVGDVFLKLSAGGNYWFLIAGAIIYASCAIGWAEVLTNITLGQLGIWYSTLFIIMSMTIGVVFMGETITLRQAIGMALAIASIMLTM